MAIIAGHGREQVKDFIQTTSEIFGRLPNIGVAAYKLPDLGQKQSQMAMFRLKFKVTPLMISMKNAMLDLGYDPDQKSTDIRASISFARSLSPTGLIYLKRRKHLQMGPSLNGEARISAMATENSGVLLRLTAKVFTTALAHC